MFVDILRLLILSTFVNIVAEHWQFPSNCGMKILLDDSSLVHVSFTSLHLCIHLRSLLLCRRFKSPPVSCLL